MEKTKAFSEAVGKFFEGHPERNKMIGVLTGLFVKHSGSYEPHVAVLERDVETGEFMLHDDSAIVTGKTRAEAIEKMKLALVGARVANDMEWLSRGGKEAEDEMKRMMGG